MTPPEVQNTPKRCRKMVKSKVVFSAILDHFLAISGRLDRPALWILTEKSENDSFY